MSKFKQAQEQLQSSIVQSKEAEKLLRKELAMQYALQYTPYRVGQIWKSCLGRIFTIESFDFNEKYDTLVPALKVGKVKIPAYNSFSGYELLMIDASGYALNEETFDCGDVIRMWDKRGDNCWSADWTLLNGIDTRKITLPVLLNILQ